jgi:hypothetical protein
VLLIKALGGGWHAPSADAALAQDESSGEHDATR